MTVSNTKGQYKAKTSQHKSSVESVDNNDSVLEEESKFQSSRFKPVKRQSKSQVKSNLSSLRKDAQRRTDKRSKYGRIAGSTDHASIPSSNKGSTQNSLILDIDISKKVILPHQNSKVTSPNSYCDTGLVSP